MDYQGSNPQCVTIQYKSAKTPDKVTTSTMNDRQQLNNIQRDLARSTVHHLSMRSYFNNLQLSADIALVCTYQYSRILADKETF